MAAPTSSPPPTQPAQPVPPAPPAPPAPRGTDDWPKQATDAIVRVVDSVRDKTSGRAVTAAAVAVYGLVIAPAAIVTGILVTISWFRLCERIGVAIAGLLGFDQAQPMWAVYLVHGLVFTLAGLLMWRKRKTPAPA